ncbi:hypothetical protein D6792_01245 [Candidatus Parcubacteria bacterium]|nr:MAG: hypothetical protein D6792_01245 [Candidatus Parcubacteria bacterium]GIW68714.1 MAG: hypothetical protein KatS3mg100_208 [Candidatus Parcubacteria bacterium]
MSYNPIQHYLAKFASFTPPNESVRRAVRDMVFEVCGITVPLENIKVVRGTVILSVHPIERSEILLNKQGILRRVRDEIPGALVRDIR